MIVFLAKVFDKKEHAEAFLKGAMYANRLSYFKEMEGRDNARGDDYEGAILPPLGGLVVELDAKNPSTEQVESITFTGTDLDAPPVIQPRWFDHINVFCMYAAHIDEHQDLSSTNLLSFKQHLELPDNYTKLGEHAIVITNTTEFFRRVKLAAGRIGYEISGNLVSYYDPEVGTPPTQRDIESIFTKRQEYEWQREFRLAINTHKTGSCPVTFEIGEIDDIAVYVKTREINRQLRVQFKPECQT